jgi:hypothetical protein
VASKYHIVKCDSDSNLIATIAFWLCVVSVIVGGCLWFWHHVMVPLGDALLTALVWAGHILFWGALGIGALCMALTTVFMIVCTVERRRHVRSSGRHRLAGVPSRGLAREDTSAPLPLQDTTTDTPFPARPVITAEIEAEIERVQHMINEAKRLGSKAWPADVVSPYPDAIIASQDDVFLLTHGIRPDEFPQF